MSPIATAIELGTYLELDTVNTTRANLMLQLANDRLSLYVDPVPAKAKGIELAVAARVYTNVSSARQAGIGSAQVSFGAENATSGIGGLYVSKNEARDLRRMAGRTGAFSIDMLAGPLPPATAPVVSSASPAVAVAGDIVQAVGYGFTGTTTVTVGGVSVEFFAGTDDRLYFTIPAGSAGATAVVVTNAIGASLPYSYVRG